MFKKGFILFCILFSYFSCAENETTVIKNKSISLEVNDTQVPLSLVGTAVRTVFFVEIYKLQLYVSHPDQFDKSQPLDSLDKLKAIAVYITASREVSGERMKTSIEEALQSNNVDTQSESIQKLLTVFNVSAKKGDKFSFIGKRLNNGTEELTAKLSGDNPPIIISEAGIIRNIFSIWLGNTSHSKGLTKLKKQLLSDN